MIDELSDQAECVLDLVLVFFLEGKDGMQSLVGLLEVCLYFLVGLLLCLEFLRMKELKDGIQGENKIDHGNSAHDDGGNSV